ncbi:MAG: glycosyltransferase family 4 protein [Patescibacteria group bacterium]|nr:glycosyltransferase family 4 protein [Patescibacteria group bacterium]
MMKIAIYSPYLDTFGGGERYMMTIAEVLSRDKKVDVLLDLNLGRMGAEYLKDELSKRFDLNLSKVDFITAPMGRSSGSLNRLFFLRDYDILFYLTDGSIFYPTSKKNILHIQSPLMGQPAKSIKGKIKLKGWDLIIYNSKFTKEHSEKNWPLESEVVYPPVDVSKIKPLKKKKYILSVGRFFGYLKDKKHSLLIRTFKELFETGKISDWSLHLVGSAGEGDKDYLKDLAKSAKGFPISFYPNLNYDDLMKLYGESSIYWHASGFAETDPTKMEHFGISTVEAMAGGCVPVVIGKGGQREIVEHESCGYLWNDLDDLKRFTLKLIKEENLRLRLAKQVVKRAKVFSKENFADRIIQIAKI